MNQRTEKKIKPENLDQEFRQILCVIREQIPYINSNAYLMQCRVWLEKLSSPDINKVLRNLYLVELCSQIQKNKLLPPFNEAPPTESLKNLTKVLMKRRKSFKLFSDLQHKKSRLSNLQNNLVTSTEDVANNLSAEPMILCPYEADTRSCVNLLKSEKEELGISKLIREVKCQQLIRNGKQKKLKIELDNRNLGKLQNKTFDCGEPIATARNDKSQTTKTNDVKENVSVRDEDSWSDLSDVSSAVEYASRRKETKPKTRIIIPNENICRNNDTSNNYTSNKMQTDISEPLNVIEFKEPKLECYNTEELNLKVPKDTNYISEDWKNTIDALQLRLSEMTQQNNGLQAVIQRMEIQMEDIRNKNKEETDQTIKMLKKVNFEDIAKLNKHHADQIFQLEKSLQAKMETFKNEYEQKLNTVITGYEQKILEISKQNKDVTTKRDHEICRLTEVIQHECTRITNDISTLQKQVTGCSCDKKLLLLKKCVVKMDKLFQRSEKEHLRQIDRLKQELEIKNTAIQVIFKGVQRVSYFLVMAYFLIKVGMPVPRFQCSSRERSIKLPLLNNGTMERDNMLTSNVTGRAMLPLRSNYSEPLRIKKWIQIKMQKAELIAETSSEQQEEFEKVLNSLEIKYIKMLEMHENQIMEIKKQDDEKIQVLKELLSQHGIPYDKHAF